jgi:Flp pilus assembly protein TadG
VKIMRGAQTFGSRFNARTQRGVAAIEFALVLVVLLLILGGIFEFGRVFWFYNAMTKATRDGARVMSTTNVLAVNSQGVPAAQNLVVAEANAARVSPPLLMANVQVECLNDSFQTVTCVDGVAPANVRVGIVNYSVVIGGWFPLLSTVGGTVSYTVTINPQTTMRYMD